MYYRLHKLFMILQIVLKCEVMHAAVTLNEDICYKRKQNYYFPKEEQSTQIAFKFNHLGCVCLLFR